MTQDNLLTPKNLSRLLGVSIQTLAAWRCLSRWDLPYIKVGRLVRYRREDVEAFVLRHTHGGEPGDGTNE